MSKSSIQIMANAIIDTHTHRASFKSNREILCNPKKSSNLMWSNLLRQLAHDLFAPEYFITLLCFAPVHVMRSLLIYRMENNFVFLLCIYEWFWLEFSMRSFIKLLCAEKFSVPSSRNQVDCIYFLLPAALYCCTLFTLYSSRWHQFAELILHVLLSLS